MNVAEYLAKNSHGAKFILGIIDPDGDDPIYIADEVYRTEPDDDPANVQFHSVITDVPRLSREIRNAMGGGITGSWGPIKLATQVVDGRDLGTENLKGKKFRMLLTGPRSLVPYSGASVVLEGYIASRSGAIDGGLTINVRDRRHLIDNISLPLNRFDSSEEGANFPDSNDGRAKPIVLGKAKNVQSPVIDSTTHKRLVSDPAYGQINNVVAVYNNGVPVSFTKDLVNNTYTPSLLPTSSEVITADIEGVTESGSLLTSHEDFISWILRTFADYSASDIDVANFPTEDAAYVIDSDRKLSSILDDLTKSVLATWLCTRVDGFKASLINAPVSGGPVFDETRQLADISWDEDLQVFYEIPYIYNVNHTKLTTLGVISDVDREIWLKAASDEGAVSQASIKTTYSDAKVSPVIKTLFIDESPAITVANRALALFGCIRCRSSVKIPFMDPPLFILDSVELKDVGILNGDNVIRSIVENYGGATPDFVIGVWK